MSWPDVDYDDCAFVVVVVTAFVVVAIVAMVVKVTCFLNPAQPNVKLNMFA